MYNFFEALRPKTAGNALLDRIKKERSKAKNVQPLSEEALQMLKDFTGKSFDFDKAREVLEDLFNKQSATDTAKINIPGFNLILIQIR